MPSYGPSHLRLSSLAAGVTITTLLVSAGNFIFWLVQSGIEAALYVDGGLGSTLGILLIVGGFGLAIGLPIAAFTLAVAPRSWLGVGLAVAIFCMLGGLFNSSPNLTLQKWLQGVILTLIFAAASIAAGAAAQLMKRYLANVA